MASGMWRTVIGWTEERAAIQSAASTWLEEVTGFEQKGLIFFYEYNADLKYLLK
jgi:hypothetical protein